MPRFMLEGPHSKQSFVLRLYIIGINHVTETFQLNYKVCEQK